MTGPTRAWDRRTHFDDVVDVGTHAEARRAVSLEPGIIAVVDRGGPRTVLFQCPCGCDDTLVINVDILAGRAWRLRVDSFGLTLMPSVWRSGGCRSHFILWRSQVWWCDWYDDEFEGDLSWPADMDAELIGEWRHIRAADDEQGNRS